MLDGEVLRADDVEDDVGGDALLLEHLGEVLLAVVDDDVGAELTTERGLLLRADRDGHPGTEGLAELDRHGADAAAPTVGEERFAVLELAHHEHVRPHRACDFHQAGRLEQGGLTRYDGDLASRYGDVLGVSTARQQRTHLGPWCQIGDTLSDGGHGAGALEAEDGGRPGRRVVEASALHEVRAVDSCCGDLDQDFAGTGFGYREVDHLEDIDVAWL